MHPEDAALDEATTERSDTGNRADTDDAEAAVCKRCNGSGWIASSKTGERVSRCICWGRETARRLIENALIPARFADSRLETLKLYGNRDLGRAVNRAKVFVKEFPREGEGLLITGPTGIGKTHIATAVLRQVILERHAHGLYYDTRELLRAIRTTYDPESGPHEVDIVAPVINADLLVLDDLGAERSTTWVHDMMTTIINARYNDCRPIIATSNYPTGVSDKSGGAGNGRAGKTLADRLGTPTISRLREMCELIEYEGLDYRNIWREADDATLRAAWREQNQRREPPHRNRGNGRR